MTMRYFQQTLSGTVTASRGKTQSPVRRSHGIKHSDATVRELILLRHQGKPIRELAAQFGMGETTVSNFCLGYQRARVYDAVMKELGIQ